MKLQHRIIGQGKPLIILHGLFGSSDNWQTHAKRFSEYFQVILVDQRNHGHTDWSDDFNYDILAEDLHELITGLGLEKVNLLGHSMGGKVAMRYAQLYPGMIEKLIVVDMGIKKYPPHHQQILEGIHAVNRTSMDSRAQAEEILTPFIPEAGTRQFLMKNLYWIEKGKLAWRMNVAVLEKEMNQILAALPEREVMVQTLFIRGALSAYIPDEDIADIENQFPDSTFVTIQHAGHWIHAEQPEEFMNAVLEFLLR
ncbi:alpha/beta fold hydrolase [Fluviicola sp.]|jgi:pimeloyl-ACP methyl ester carboxylesterase|uniref:alpha/beta fold hydrolase n=1 Tax=Fluviicola sp. TaxID=1917219 RepID=UPI00282D4827|nr:alpha/beta fold hydrolase [Fluviicola sp.]MDR0801338.1 alpha/beta fold hydrolase [Fluviicola sp.]